MAGAGYKLFNTGDVLTAAQVNTYLMQQTVMVFADATARTTALSGVLAEGMLSYLQDTNATEVYNGSAWVNIGADQTPLTTKGDLFTYTTQDARLGVGTDGQILTADSSQSTGLKWATNTNVEPFLVTKTAANYYGIGFVGSATSRTPTANNTYYAAIYFDGATTFDRIGFRTFSNFSGTGVFRFGIYNASATTGLPSTVYLDAGTISATAGSTNYLITINSTPPKGYYWLAANSQTAAGTNTCFGLGTVTGNIVNPFNKGASSETAGIDYAYLTESVNVSSGFATAGSLTVGNTLNILPFLRTA